jgi:putative FmdB family regulatory protein
MGKMPLFDYACKKCGATEEVLMGRDDDEPSHCGKTMERLKSIPRGIVVKGSDGRSVRLGEATVTKDANFTYTVKNVEG